MQYNPYYVINQLLKAHREGDLIMEAIWADIFDELNYIY